MIRISLYCPAESTYPRSEGEVKLAEVPAVGDLVFAPWISPATGPGAGWEFFKVTSRTWGARGRPVLYLTRLWS